MGIKYDDDVKCKFIFKQIKLRNGQYYGDSFGEPFSIVGSTLDEVRAQLPKPDQDDQAWVCVQVNPVENV